MGHSIVIDTVVFVRSLLNPHSAPGKLIFTHADEYRLILSAPIIREILEVLQRPEITRKIRFVAGMDIKRVLDLLSQAELVELPADIPQVSRDPTINSWRLPFWAKPTMSFQKIATCWILRSTRESRSWISLRF